MAKKIEEAPVEQNWLAFALELLKGPLARGERVEMDTEQAQALLAGLRALGVDADDVRMEIQQSLRKLDIYCVDR